MKVLLVGSGGREHALAWAIARSPRCASLWCAPGNPGIAAHARCVPIAADDVDGIVSFARQERVDLVVIGPELPLVRGLVDRLDAAGIASFGPRAAAARLEGSKGFMKELCARHGIPTARFARFSDLDAALAYVRAEGAPIVVKADGLAAGKGVVVAQELAEAEAAVRDMLGARRFGEAGGSVVIEALLTGPELSFFALCDGARAVPFSTAMDYKRVGDGDRGPNTGGMGAISPHPLATPALERALMETLVEPTLRAMEAEGAPFRGVLYAGVMLTPEGPKLLEYNVRFGDPECQALVARLDVDLLDVLDAASRGALDAVTLRWRDEAAACVVMAAAGYPEAPRTGDRIDGIDEARAEDPGVLVLHAGTRRDEVGALRTAGGRVLGVVALGADVGAAARRALATTEHIRFDGAHWRRDVGTLRR